MSNKVKWAIHFLIIGIGMIWTIFSIKLSEGIAMMQWWMLAVIMIALLINMLFIIMDKPLDSENKFLTIAMFILGGVELVLGVIFLTVFLVLYNSFNGITMTELMWVIHSNMQGANISNFYLQIIVGVIAVVATVSIYLWMIRKSTKGKRAFRCSLLSFSVISFGLFLIAGLLYKHLLIGSYIRNQNEFSDFLKTNWTDASEVEINFEEKRNLIFIFLESMEITFSGEENGGASQMDIIPELTQIAQENICFTDNETMINGE